jgi:hypothetical protein
MTEARQGERRLPMALAVLAVAVLYLFVPDDFRLAPWTRIAFPVFLVVLLLVLVIGDPGRIDREVRWLRMLTGVMIAIITVFTLVAAVRLVLGILHKSPFADAGQLLVIGGIILFTNMVAYALWFWHLDSGGPAARAHGRTEQRPAFVFPEQSVPHLVGEGWYPQFVDYFAVSFNTSTAFSPTDVSAIRHWAKLFMVVESSTSLLLVALVIARAINIL